MPNRFHPLLISLFLQSLPPFDAQLTFFLDRYLPPPRIQSLFVGLVRPLVPHFLHPVSLTLGVFAFHLVPLLFGHGMVASHTLLGLFGLKGLLLPIGSHTSHLFVVASTVHGLHVLDPIQGRVLALPIQFLVVVCFFQGPVFSWGAGAILA